MLTMKDVWRSLRGCRRSKTHKSRITRPKKRRKGGRRRKRRRRGAHWRRWNDRSGRRRNGRRVQSRKNERGGSTRRRGSGTRSDSACRRRLKSSVPRASPRTTARLWQSMSSARWVMVHASSLRT
ncbi:hypothetical protein NFJ02_16g22860 [Pycnococcus provasolii]